MKFESERKDNIVLIHIHDDINFENTKDLKSFVKKLVDDEKIINIVVNLEFVEFIDSSGLGTLVSLLTFLRKINGNLKLTNINENIDELFKLTRLYDFFEIYTNIDEAVDSFTD